MTGQQTALSVKDVLLARKDARLTWRNTFAYMVYKPMSVPCLMYYAGCHPPHLPRSPLATLSKQLMLAAPCRS